MWHSSASGLTACQWALCFGFLLAAAPCDSEPKPIHRDFKQAPEAAIRRIGETTGGPPGPGDVVYIGGGYWIPCGDRTEFRGELGGDNGWEPLWENKPSGERKLVGINFRPKAKIQQFNDNMAEVEGTATRSQLYYEDLDDATLASLECVFIAEWDAAVAEKIPKLNFDRVCIVTEEASALAKLPEELKYFILQPDFLRSDDDTAAQLDASARQQGRNEQKKAEEAAMDVVQYTEELLTKEVVARLATSTSVEEYFTNFEKEFPDRVDRISKLVKMVGALNSPWNEYNGMELGIFVRDEMHEGNIMAVVPLLKGDAKGEAGLARIVFGEGLRGEISESSWNTLLPWLAEMSFRQPYKINRMLTIKRLAESETDRGLEILRRIVRGELVPATEDREGPPDGYIVLKQENRDAFKEISEQAFAAVKLIKHDPEGSLAIVQLFREKLTGLDATAIDDAIREMEDEFSRSTRPD